MKILKQKMPFFSFLSILMKVVSLIMPMQATHTPVYAPSNKYCIAHTILDISLTSNTRLDVFC